MNVYSKMAAAISLSVLCVSVPPGGFPTAHAMEGAPTKQERAGKFASILVTQEILNQNAEKILQASVKEMIKNDAEFRADIKAYPGLDRAFLNAMRPIMYEEMASILLPYREDIAAFFGRKFTSNELSELTAFWGSPQGRRILATLNAQADYSNIAEDVMKDMDSDKVEISDASLKRDMDGSINRGIKALSDEDTTALVKFAQSPLGVKFAKVRPEKQQIELKWANVEPSAAAMARIEKEIPAAMDAFITAAEKKKTASGE